MLLHFLEFCVHSIESVIKTVLKFITNTFVKQLLRQKNNKENKNFHNLFTLTKNKYYFLAKTTSHYYYLLHMQ